MSTGPGRIYRIAKAYLDAARDRLAEVDSSAQAELEKALGPEPSGGYFPSSSDDPTDRAIAKINAARGESGARREIRPEQYNFSTPEQTAQTSADSTPVLTAYKVIGVPAGSDFATVEAAVTKLRERAAPNRFAQDSPEQLEAQRIQDRVDEAFRVIQDALGVEANRFDRLEL